MPRAITICGQRLVGPRHLCAFFDSRDEQHAAFLPYFAEGLKNGEQVVYILDRSRHGEARQRMAKHGIDVLGREASEQLRILSSDETYISGGIFAADRMFDLVVDMLRVARANHGYVRTLGEMDWALRNLPGTEELIDYECRLNYLLDRYDCTLCCSYDLGKLTGQAVMDVLSTHSHVVMGRTVQSNPYYLAPDEFRRLNARRLRLPSALAAANG